VTSPLEIGANAVNALSIVLAGRNSAHTWWTGIVGCVLYGWLFYGTQLYADATLQVFFVVTSIIGWKNWARGDQRPVARTGVRALLTYLVIALLLAAGYSALLHRYTDAFAPVPDSLVLVFSGLAQLLLMRRRIETWYFWLLVNTIAVPLFFHRGLMLTGALYACFWINALVALRHWRRLAAQ
jgi:nicotinamide mononucleotide transporter